MKEIARLRDYKRHWEESSLQYRRQCEYLRRDALRVAQRLKDILINEYGVKKVILFGSVLQQGRFNEQSVIDIGVEGLLKADYFKALGRLMIESR